MLSEGLSAPLADYGMQDIGFCRRAGSKSVNGKTGRAHVNSGALVPAAHGAGRRGCCQWQIGTRAYELGRPSFCRSEPSAGDVVNGKTGRPHVNSSTPSPPVHSEPPNPTSQWRNGTRGCETAPPPGQTLRLGYPGGPDGDHDLVPALEALVRGERRRSVLVAPVHELEEEDGTAAGDREAADLVRLRRGRPGSCVQGDLTSILSLERAFSVVGRAFSVVECAFLARERARACVCEDRVGYQSTIRTGLTD